MPFGGYADMAACVKANGDKADPEAYCATLMREAEKAERADRLKRFTIEKVDEDQRLVFGYASVSVTSDGQLLEDLHGDLIEPHTLEKAAYDFNLYARGMDEMHEREPVGQMVESFVVTPEKLKAMDLTPGPKTPQVAWWVAFKLSPESFVKVKAGTFKMLSIELVARAEAA